MFDAQETAQQKTGANHDDNTQRGFQNYQQAAHSKARTRWRFASSRLQRLMDAPAGCLQRGPDTEHNSRKNRKSHAEDEYGTVQTEFLGARKDGSRQQFEPGYAPACQQQT